MAKKINMENKHFPLNKQFTKFYFYQIFSVKKTVYKILFVSQFQLKKIHNIN